MDKRNRQWEKENLRKLKTDETEEKPSDRNGKSLSPVKNDDTEQALSM
jgi:hypothetical protein